MAGADRLVGLGLDAGRHAHEGPPDSRRRSPLGLVERVEHDERTNLGSGAQLLVRLVVAVEEDLPALDPSRSREGELPERRDVGADPLLREQPQQRDVRERLRPVDDERLGCGGAKEPRPLAQRALAVRRRAASRTAPPARSLATPPIVSSPSSILAVSGNSASIRASEAASSVAQEANAAPPRQLPPASLARGFFVPQNVTARWRR